MLSIHCTNKITDGDLKALTQPERKRLGQIVKRLMTGDRHLTRDQAVQKAYPLLLVESVPFRQERF